MSSVGAMWDGYGRVSQVGARDAESERFHSTALQQTSVEGWLQRHGFRLGVWVEDLNLSGGRRRPKLEELVARVESGVSAGLAVYNLSRFSRETLLGLADIDRIVAAGGRFVAVNDGVDTDDPNWRLNATIRLAIDSDYLRRTRDGFRAVRQRLVAMGVHVTNWDNVGYQRGDDLRYQPHPEFGPVMREAFLLRARDHSLRQVADLLAEAG
jgi:DNA invertase Pin-like site-specific DNA recombinase